MQILDQKLQTYAIFPKGIYRAEEHFLPHPLLSRLLLASLFALFLVIGGCGSVLWPSPEADENQPEQTEEEQEQTAEDSEVEDSEVENDPLEAAQTADSAPDADQLPADQSPGDKISQPILRIVFRTAATAYQSSLFSVLEMLDDKYAAVENNLVDYDILALAIDDSTAALEQSESYAKRVRQSLLDMGVAPDHIHIFQAALDIEFPMVIVYIR